VSEKGKDRLFLAYANYSLRVDLKNFFKIFDVYERGLSSLADIWPTKNLKEQIEAVVECEFTKKNFVESVISKKPDPDVGTFYAADMHLVNAIEALYGYRDGFCENQCPVRKIREEKWGREPFEGPDRWKCVECDQFDFVRVLMDIMDGIAYSEIEGFLPKPTRQYLEAMFSPYSVVEGSDKKSEEYSPSIFRAPILPLDATSSKLGFRGSWNVLVGNNLEGFLTEEENNWRRLKLCPYCHEFFIAKSVDRKICYSQDCEKARQREQKRPYMQKKRDPDSPEFDLRYKTREFTEKKPS
jgi:hypothetical protein